VLIVAYPTLFDRKTTTKELREDSCQNDKKREEATNIPTPTTYQHPTMRSDLVPPLCHTNISRNSRR
jgi:hypothetical protein